ncbi:MAG: haloacid dehalogenase-like hydrolase, partial [Bacteroidota bacterium]
MHRSGVFSARRALNCLAVIAVVATAGCERQEQRTMADPLASWNEGAAKQSIVGFVKEVTDKTNPDYVPVPDRIAVFDNDGTLWSERPVYFQFYFVID